MTNSLRYDLQQLGHLARTAQLGRLGHGRRSIESAVREGWLTRPVSSWVATRDARRDAVIAAAHRGVLTNSSALDSYGVWRAVDPRIHVLVPAHSSGGHKKLLVSLTEFPPPAIASSGVVRHWGTPRTPTAGWRVTVVDALASFASTQSPEFFVAAVDSALHTGALLPAMLPWLRQVLPARLQRELDLVDARAGAGTETLARLRLAILGCRCDIQVTVGPYRLDLLIDGWLNIEIDSEAWHGSDRLTFSRRDTWLVARGFVVLRFDYDEIMFEWPACLAAIQTALLIGPPRVR